MFDSVKRRIIVMSPLILLILAASFPCIAQSDNDTNRTITIAPLNPEFCEYLSQFPNSIGSMTDSGRPLELVPVPIDLSHTKGQSGLSAAVLPATYDLRTESKLTSVKDQGNIGSCWTFGVYGSLESALLPSETWDFSENNMKNLHGFDIPQPAGGNYLMGTAYLARWSGPVLETDDLYNPNSNYSPSGLSVQKHVQEVKFLPDRSSYTDNNAIKQAIMDHGAVQTGMFWNDNYYNASTSTYYFDNYSVNNHSLCIIGWNDNFAKEKFAKTPPDNGAFIAKNSWGASWGENGYVYISYYDSKIGTQNAVFVKPDSTSKYTHIYQYDPLGWISSGGFSSSTAWFANVFKADSNQSLAAVSFYSASVNSTYTISIYLDPTSGPIKQTGPVVSKSGVCDCGYETVSLDQLIPISAQQTFAVVVMLTTPDTAYPIPIESPETGYSSAASASSGQSFVSPNGTDWIDLTTPLPNNNVCIKAFTVNANVDDTVAPTVKINNPTSANSTSTNALTTIISGTATDNIDVTGVSWSNNTGSTGNCTGTTSWSTNQIPIKIGTNVITITAMDASGNTGTASITIKCVDTSARKWQGMTMISCPVIPSDTDPKPIIGFHGNAWFAFDTSKNNYSVYPDPSTWFRPAEITPGRGFWAIFDRQVSVPKGNVPAQDQPFTLHIQPGWNIIGQPFLSPVKWDINAIKVRTSDGSLKELKYSEDCVGHIAWGWSQNTANPNKGYYYLIADPAVSPGAVGELAPWQAFWIMGFKECDLVLPPPGN